MFVFIILLDGIGKFYIGYPRHQGSSDVSSFEIVLYNLVVFVVDERFG